MSMTTEQYRITALATAERVSDRSTPETLRSTGALATEAALNQPTIFPETGPADRSQEVYRLSRNPDNYYEINIESDLTVDDLEASTPKALMNAIRQMAEQWRGKTGYVISSTFEGGGVAMQEAPIIHYLQLMGIDIHWLVSAPHDEAFMVTKKMHNLQQDVLSPQEQFMVTDERTHRGYGKANFHGMKEKIDGFTEADFYWFEDPQLVAMLPDLKHYNPDARYIYRNHIQTDRDKMATEGSPQNAIYKYLHQQCGVDQVDAYVAHPVEQFVPYDMHDVAYMPPTSDMKEDLVRSLTDQEIQDNRDWVNGQVTKQNRIRQEEWSAFYDQLYGEGNWSEEWAHVDDQTSIDWNRPIITGFARFDRAKGKNYDLQLGKLITDELRARGAPKSLEPLVICAGNGATDDPDRQEVLSEILQLRRDDYTEYKDNLMVLGLDHNYTAVNALFRSSMYTINFSTKEGFEHRRTESMIKGKPSLSTNAGGLPKQGEDGQGGLVADLNNIDSELGRIAHEVVEDLLDPERYAARVQQTLDWAEQFSKPELTTAASLYRELRILNGHGDRQWKISEQLDL